MELLLSIAVARTLRKPEENQDPASNGKEERNPVVNIGIISYEPELKGNVSHHKSKDCEYLDSRCILYSSWHHFNNIDVCYIVASCLCNST